MAVLLGLGLALTVRAPAVEPVQIRSRSGQFTVRGLPMGSSFFTAPANADAQYMRLDPALAVVSLERIKAALLAELGARDQWRGAVQVALRPVAQDREPITVMATRYADGWSYRLEVPELVNKDRLLKATVQVLLLEIANRRAGERPAELPPWLAEGLAAHLRATSLATLLLEPQTGIVAHERSRDPLRRAREVLQGHQPLGLDELNMPTEEQLAWENAEVYAICAQLFVHELLRLRGGRACLREMLTLLPEHLNWQTAFLRAFQPHFPRLLDVDKWWAVAVVNFTGRELYATWPRAQSYFKLAEILITPVQVRLDPKDLPVTTDVTLQRIISEWDFAQQAPLLHQKLQQLRAARPRVTSELGWLVDNYTQVLAAYLQKRGGAGLEAAAKHQLPPNPRVAVKQTLRQLDELDELRDYLRRKVIATQASARP